MPFFPATVVNADQPWRSGGIAQTFDDFRCQQNKRLMARLYASLRQVAPALSLYLDDCVSSYANPNTRRYCRWERAERIPQNPIYAVTGEARGATFHVPSEPLLAMRGWHGNPNDLARTLGDMAQETLRWRGIVLELQSLKPEAAIETIRALPDAASLDPAQISNTL